MSKPGPVPSMAGKTVVVTGANSGIGKETARALVRAGARVLCTGRDEGRLAAACRELAAEPGGGSAEPVVFDLASLASVEQGAAELAGRAERLDVLVNNAGLVLTDRRLSVDGYEMTLAVNHLGPFYLTLLLADRLVASAPARVVNVASTAHKGARKGLDFDDLQSSTRYRGMRVYSASKLANILFTTELARRLAPSGVTANCLHPGTVHTGYGRDGDTHGFLTFGLKISSGFFLSPEKGARTSVYLATSPAVAGTSGAYFVRCKEKKASAAARDAAAASQLWAASEALVRDAGRPLPDWPGPAT
jgi:NAD(P)-dependent dehydrogenase (short-subunit alcohol dehydrogenase family)